MKSTEKYLPIGSVVLLKNGTKRVMIYGYCAISEDETNAIYDYCGVCFQRAYLKKTIHYYLTIIK